MNIVSRCGATPKTSAPPSSSMTGRSRTVGPRASLGSTPTGDVPLHRWRRFVDDVGLFLDSSFARQAAALGWGPYDVFGCDRERPFARVDPAGLLWLLGGARLVTLAEDAAGIETRTGARKTCRRKPSEPGRVLAWELAP